MENTILIDVNGVEVVPNPQKAILVARAQADYDHARWCDGMGGANERYIEEAKRYRISGNRKMEMASLLPSFIPKH